MILLVGECTGKRVADIQERGWGRMWVGRKIHLYPGEPWGFDNGAFAAWKHGESWSVGDYLNRLLAALALPTGPYLAVIPDRVASELSLAYSRRWLDLLLDLLPEDPRWPWYLALQDGMTFAAVEPLVPSIAGLFLGGSDEFKKQAASWCAFAHHHGLRFHYGRASRFERLEHCLEMGADSCDSTTFMWTRSKWSRLLDWWDDSRLHQQRLPLARRGIDP